MGAAVAFGLCTGLLAHITAAALGVSAVVYGIPYAFQAVKVMGALYLFYLAWLSWKSIRSQQGSETKPKQEEGDVSSTAFLQLYRRGILMNILNPKVSLFFLAFLPQFVAEDKGSVAWQMLGLGGVFLLQALVIFNIMALLANRIGRKFLQGEGARRWTGWFQALLYGALGLQLLFV